MAAAAERATEDAAAAEPLAVGQCFLGIRYLSLEDASGDRALPDLRPLLCQQCERTLSYTDQLLCTRRRWGFDHAPPEPACFVNSVVRSNVVIRGRYEEQLAQGLMDMGDIFCKCGTQVGYAFLGDKTPERRNLNQVGRMGLVASRFLVAPYKLSHSKRHRAQ